MSERKVDIFEMFEQNVSVHTISLFFLYFSLAMSSHAHACFRHYYAASTLAAPRDRQSHEEDIYVCYIYKIYVSHTIYIYTHTFIVATHIYIYMYISYRDHRRSGVRWRPPTLSHSRFFPRPPSNPNILLRQQFHGRWRCCGDRGTRQDGRGEDEGASGVRQVGEAGKCRRSGRPGHCTTVKQ